MHDLDFMKESHIGIVFKKFFFLNIKLKKRRYFFILGKRYKIINNAELDNWMVIGYEQRSVFL